MNKNIFHVLIVDDDDRIRELVKEYLEENNFIVTSTKDALDAKKKIKNIKIRYINIRHYDAWRKWTIFNKRGKKR